MNKMENNKYVTIEIKSQEIINIVASYRGNFWEGVNHMVKETMKYLSAQGRTWEQMEFTLKVKSESINALEETKIKGWNTLMFLLTISDGCKYNATTPFWLRFDKEDKASEQFEANLLKAKQNYFSA